MESEWAQGHGLCRNPKKEAETIELPLVFTTLGSDQLNKGNEHKRRDWVFNVASKTAPGDDWKIICKLPITILKEVTGKTRISRKHRKTEVRMEIRSSKGEEATRSKLERIRRYLVSLRTSTNAHLQNIQEILDETLQQTRTYPPTIEMNNALEDTEIDETVGKDRCQKEKDSGSQYGEIDPRTMTEVIDELEYEGKTSEEESLNNQIKIEQWLDWEVQCLDIIEEHRGPT